MGQDVDFTLLQMTKGSIVPQKANTDGSVTTLTHNTPATSNNSLDSSRLTMSSVLPECTADCAVYNRLMYLTYDNMRQLFAHDRAVLQQFRQLCLPAPSNVNNIQKATNTVNTTDSNFPPLGGNVWAAKNGTTSGANKPPLNNTSSSNKPTSTSVGDVEALPFIQLALERQQQLEMEFENKLKQKAMVNSLMMDAPVSTASTISSSITTNSTNTIGENTLTNKLYYHIYQHSSGSLVFMHPICAKCILEASVSAGLSTNTSDGSTVHSIVPQQLSPRTQLQKKLASSSPVKSISNSVSDSTTDATTTNLGVNTDFTKSSTTADHSSENISLTASAATAEDTANTLTNIPLHPVHLHTTLRARVIDAERVRVTSDTRARYNVLRHLPLHSEALLLEIDLAGIVPQHILCKYSEELNKRALRRKERAKQEKREKRLEQDRRYCIIYLSYHVLFSL